MAGVYSLYSKEVFPVSPREMFVGGERGGRKYGGKENEKGKNVNFYDYFCMARCVSEGPYTELEEYLWPRV